MSTKPSPASGRFSVFRSWAREISEKAKWDKNLGRTVDINGQMARAMERAYKQGFEDAQTGSQGIAVSDSRDPNDASPVPDSLVGSKISGALHSIGLRQMGTEQDYQPDASIRACFIQEDSISTRNRKAPDWQVYPAYSDTYEKGVSDRTIQQLVKLGILQAATSSDPDLHGKNILVLSAKGRATYTSMFIDGRS